MPVIFQLLQLSVVFWTQFTVVKVLDTIATLTDKALMDWDHETLRTTGSFSVNLPILYTELGVAVLILSVPEGIADGVLEIRLFQCGSY